MIPVVSDFTYYWFASRQFVHGANPYSLEPMHGLMMLAPPWILAVISPLGWLPLHVAEAVWLGISLAARGLSLSWLWQIYAEGRPKPRWAGWLIIAFVPVFMEFVLGQMDMVMLLGIAGFLRYQKRCPFVPGMFLFLTAWKPQVAFLVWPALLLGAVCLGRWMSLLGLVVTVASASLAVMRARPSVFLDYWAGYLTNRSGFYETAALFSGLPYILPALALIWLSWRWRTSGWDWNQRMPELLLASAVASPHIWPADHVLLIPALLQAMIWLERSRLRIAIASVYCAVNGIMAALIASQQKWWYSSIIFIWLGLYAVAKTDKPPDHPISSHDTSKPLLRSYMPELHSLRGIACLAVLFFHGLWWYIPESATGFAGWLRDLTAEWHRGVSLFFVLSGMLITGILRDSKDQPDYFRRFYKRRALRILPAYYLMLVLLWLFGDRVTPQFLRLSAVYLANMAPLLGVFMAYGPLWSLAVEEQFYLFWPLLVRRFSNRTIAFLSVGVFLNSIVLTLGLRTSSPQATFPIWYAAHGLALGDLLALFLRSRWASRSNVRKLAGGFSLAGLAMVSLSRSHWFSRPVGMAFECGWDFVFAALLLVALLVGTSQYEAWTRPRWLQFFGDISYGLYLIHVLVFTTYRRLFHPASDLRSILIQFAACFAASVALAALSRYTVEAWFLSLKESPLRFWRKQVSYEGILGQEG